MNEIKEQNNYTFNFKKFNILKKNLNIFLKERYNQTLNQLFNDKKTKEAVYKYILWFEWTNDIFKSWRKENISDLNLDNNIIDIILELKEHTKKILYSE